MSTPRYLLRRFSWALLAAAVALLAWLPLRPAAVGAELAPMRAPEFTQTDPQAWLNSAPLTLTALRGKVILLDFWTFECWNCYRSFPWLKALESEFATQGLQVIGIHTPEFAHEHERSAVAAKIREFGLPHPVMLDNDYAYWKAIGNRYWPSFWLIDHRGQLRARFIGETHVGSRQAERISAALRQLLAEARNAESG